MNFYKHHIGDYAQATAHLSFVEDAAFSRLIRKYYAEEQPLPTDIKAVQRLIGARTKEEKEAVQLILEEFFILEADGWHNKRCDEELAKANHQAEVNRQTAIAREERRAELKRIEELRKQGINSVNDSSHDSLHKPDNDSSHDSSAVREPSQTPDTRHQTPDFKNKAAAENTQPVLGAEKKPPPLPPPEERPTPPIDYEPFQMHEDWEPSEQFDTLCKMAGVKLGAKSPINELKEFRTYWFTRPNMKRSQNEWDHAFVKSLKHKQERG